MPETKNIRNSSFKHQRFPREFMHINVVAAQAADVTVSLTNSRFFKLTGAATDTGQDISKFYRTFAIQTNVDTIQADPVPVGQNVTVEVNLGGANDWVSCPATFTSNGGASLLPGELMFVQLPMTGVSLRLKVVQPTSDTNFHIRVAMVDTDHKPKF